MSRYRSLINYASTPPPSNLFLDNFPNAGAAYSLRKLRNGYSGRAIRVRRSSDNTEMDIGFVSNELDTISLLSFCGGSNGFVTIWYDQSTNGRNATQTTLINQPQIVVSGSVNLENGKPAILNTASTGLKTSAIQFGSMDYLSFYLVSKSNNTTQILFESSANFSSNIGSFILNKEGSTRHVLATYSPAFNLNYYTPTTLSRSIISAYIDEGSTGLGRSDVYVNNAILSESNGGTALITFTDQILSLFSRNGSSFGLVGSYQEFIFYPTNNISDRTAINNSINTFYNIY